MIPSDYNLWWDGLPSIRIDMDWRDYMVKVVDGELPWHSFAATLVPDPSFNEGPSGSTHYINGHELAHFIMASDEDVLKPDWGIPFDGPFNNDFVDKKKARLEVEVVFIQEKICNYTWARHNFLTWYNQFAEQFPHVFKDPWVGGIIAAKAICRPSGTILTDGQVQAIVSELMHTNKWSIEKIWAELERKKALVASLLA